MIKTADRLALLFTFAFAFALQGCATHPPPETESSGADQAKGYCPSHVETLDYWQGIKAQATSLDGNQYALSLADCLASPDPVLRDQIAYEVLTYWLRKNMLSASTSMALTDKLLPWLTMNNDQAASDSALNRAFSALILSELVRADDRTGSAPKLDIKLLTNRATTMFINERDYRGLDPELGWIHTIAHGGDLLWRLSMHSQVTDAEQRSILVALNSQLTRDDTPAFTFNESDRLARVVVAIVNSRQLPAAELTEWIDSVAAPGLLGQWSNAFASVEGMARLHNSKQFLRALREQLGQLPANQYDQQLGTLLAKLP